MKEPISKKINKTFTWAMMLFPLWVTLTLLPVNPDYWSHLFRLEEPYVVYPYLPCGWIIVLLALGLVGVALITNGLVDRSNKSGRLVYLAKILIFLLFVLPATFLMILSPAGFQILRSGALEALGN